MPTPRFPVLRSSVFSVAAVIVVSILAWSFESYRIYLWESHGGATALALRVVVSTG